MKIRKMIVILLAAGLTSVCFADVSFAEEKKETKEISTSESTEKPGTDDPAGKEQTKQTEQAVQTEQTKQQEQANQQELQDVLLAEEMIVLPGELSTAEPAESEAEIVTPDDQGYEAAMVKRVFDILVSDSALSETELAEMKLTLVADSVEQEDMRSNSENLQGLMDAVSASGGGTILLPAGRFYFMGIAPYNELAMYNGGLFTACIEMRDNILLSGTTDASGNVLTTVLPYSSDLCAFDWEEKKGSEDSYYYEIIPNNMFQHMGMSGEEPEYCVNFDVQNLIVDCRNVLSTTEFNSMSKGFAGELFRDCDFTDVTVRESEGSGFGMDCLINCTFRYCKAENCGRKTRGDKTAIGSSGFGIGYGASPEECCYIVNCTSNNNTKFGFFFESQYRYRSQVYPEKVANGTMVLEDGRTIRGLVVEQCAASGNLYNYGGEYCFETTYIDNFSYKTDYSRYDYWFGIQSENNAIIRKGQEISVMEANPGCAFYTDIPYDSATAINSWFFDTVNLLCRRGILANYDTGDTGFRITDETARAQFVLMLYRLVGEPEVTYTDKFLDVKEGVWYTDAILWAAENGITTGYSDGRFGPADPVTREQMVVFLYRFAEYLGCCDGNGISFEQYPDASRVSGFAVEAVSWGSDKNIFGGDTCLRPQDTSIRAEAAHVIRNFMDQFGLQSLDV